MALRRVGEVDDGTLPTAALRKDDIVTSPQDPFASPPPEGRPVPPAYGSPPGEGPSYGQQQHGEQYGQQYGQPPYGTAGQPRAARNGIGIAALVMGILGLITSWLVFGGLLGLVAVVLGVIGRSRAKRGEATNGGVALAGIITGVLAIALSVLIVVGLVSLFGSDSVANFAECIEQAGDDQAAIEQCSQQFEENVTGG